MYTYSLPRNLQSHYLTRIFLYRIPPPSPTIYTTSYLLAVAVASIAGEVGAESAGRKARLVWQQKMAAGGIAGLPEQLPSGGGMETACVSVAWQTAFGALLILTIALQVSSRKHKTHGISSDHDMVLVRLL